MSSVNNWDILTELQREDIDFVTQRSDEWRNIYSSMILPDLIAERESQMSFLCEVLQILQYNTGPYETEYKKLKWETVFKLQDLNILIENKQGEMFTEMNPPEPDDDVAPVA